MAGTDWQRKKHNSLETAEFREYVEDFIKHCCIDSENQYHLKNNLSFIIRLPYYGESKGPRPKGRYDHMKIVLDLCKYLIQYNDYKFTERLLMDLTVQQNQSLRKIAKRRKDINRLSSKDGCWEHIIPVNVVKNELLKILKGKLEQEKKLEKIKKVLTIYEKAGQLHITIEDDEKLNSNNYKESMPADWDWSEEKIFSRYINSGIDLAKYMDV